MAKRTKISIRGRINTKAKGSAEEPTTISAGIPGIGEFHIVGSASYVDRTWPLAGQLLGLLLDELRRLDPKAAKQTAVKLGRGLDVAAKRAKAGARSVNLTDRDVRRN